MCLRQELPTQKPAYLDRSSEQLRPRPRNQRSTRRLRRPAPLRRSPIRRKPLVIRAVLPIPCALSVRWIPCNLGKFDNMPAKLAVNSAVLWRNILRPVAGPMLATELSGPLSFTPSRLGCLAFQTFEHASEVSFTYVASVKNILKLKLNTETHQNQSVFPAAFPQELEQFHFRDHRRSGLALVHGDTDAKYITPVRAEFAGQGARGSANASAEILNGRIPDKISGGRLARVRGVNPDHRMGLYAQYPKSHKENLTIADIDVGADLSFTDAPRFIDRCLHVAGLTNARPDGEFELFLASEVEEDRSPSETNRSQG